MGVRTKWFSTGESRPKNRLDGCSNKTTLTSNTVKVCNYFIIRLTKLIGFCLKREPFKREKKTLEMSSKTKT